jgi:TolB-like protein
MTDTSRQILRFRDCELDLHGYVLRREGRLVRLERQPMDLLILLVGRRPDLVTHQDIVTHLWGDDVFLDVETGINTAIRKIRRAVNDGRDKTRCPWCIETVAGKGYRFVAEVAEVTEADRRSVMLAVLPFVNLSGDPELEYVADGLTEDAIAAISQVAPDRLRVIGRTSSMSYKNTRKSLAAIGSDLKVQFIVDGSLRTRGRQIQVRGTLNRVADHTQITSVAAECDAAALTGVAHELSVALAAHIPQSDPPRRIASLSRRQSTSADAYDAYLRGRRFWYQLTPATTRKAVEYYTRATEIDPVYALAWTGIAEAFASGPINGDAEPTAMWSRARDAARRAFEANPDLSEAHAVNGQVNWFFEWDWLAALEWHRRAIALDASNAWSHTTADR